VESAGPAGHVVQREFHQESVAADDLPPEEPPSDMPSSLASTTSDVAPLTSLESPIGPAETLSWSDLAGRTWLQQFTTLLAIIGAIALIMQLARLAN
jgi:hypothetical protein